MNDTVWICGGSADDQQAWLTEGTPSNRPRMFERPDLDWVLGDDGWRSYANNPVSNLSELVAAIESVGTNTPTEIQISANIELDGTVRMEGIPLPAGAVIKLTSVADNRYYISGMNERRIFLIPVAASLYLSNIILRDGFHNLSAGCLLINGGTLVMQRDSVITDCHGDTDDPNLYHPLGGAIHMNIEDPTIGSRAILMENALIEDCSAWNQGGAIDAQKYSLVVLMDDALIRRCTSQYGGAVQISGFGEHTSTLFMLGESQISGCTAAYMPGGYAHNGNGGGINAHVGGDVIIADDASINGCISGGYGGALCTSYGGSKAGHFLCEYDIRDNASIIGNYAEKYGGAIYQENNCVCTLRDNAAITQNTAGIDGGGVCINTGAVLAIENAADVLIQGNTAVTGDGGGIWSEASPNPNLFIPAGVRFIDNHAARVCDDPSDAVKAIEAQTVFATVFTTPFTHAYNNCDINVRSGDCADYPPSDGTVSITAQALMCCSMNIAGLFTAVLTDSDGNVIDETTNDARGKFAFAIQPPTAPGLYQYTIAQKINAPAIRQDKRKFAIAVTVSADGNAKVSYPHMRPLFLNFCK